MNVLAELNHRGQGLIDPWDYADPADNPPGEVRTIVVTPEMVAQDARDRAAREALSPEHPWAAFKATLGRVTHRPGLPRAHAGDRNGRSTGQQRLCGSCKRAVRVDLKGELCPVCRRKAEARPRAAAVVRLCLCGVRLSRKSKTGRCRKCNAEAMRARSPKVEARTCSGCPRRLRANNPRDTCWQCGAKRDGRALSIPLVKCSNAECDRMLRRGRAEGPCGKCKADARSTETSASRQARYIRNRNEKAGKRCKTCNALMKYSARSEYCLRHLAGATRASRTILLAGSREELELDRTWSQLSLEDKRAVFADVLEAAGGG